MIASVHVDDRAPGQAPDAAFTTALGVVVPAVDRHTMAQLEARWFTAHADDGSAYLRLAGERLATVVAGLLSEVPASLVVVAGGGWNGRIGLAAARIASLAGNAVTVVAVGPHWATPAGRSSLRVLHQSTPVRVVPLRRLGPALSQADVVIDAVVGSGLRGHVRPTFATAIRSMNRCARRIVSVDVPSGLDADTGVAWGPVVRPTVTLTLGLPKRGLAEARASMSSLLLADMRLPRDALAAVGLDLGRLDPFAGAPVVTLQCHLAGSDRCDQAA